MMKEIRVAWPELPGGCDMEYSVIEWNDEDHSVDCILRFKWSLEDGIRRRLTMAPEMYVAFREYDTQQCECDVELPEIRWFTGTGNVVGGSLDGAAIPNGTRDGQRLEWDAEKERWIEREKTSNIEASEHN